MMIKKLNSLQRLNNFRFGSKKISSKGFTFIEVMIAVAIFGFLMLYVSQLMTQQVRHLDKATEQNEMQQKARVAMMQVLDEIRLNANTYYYDGGATDSGIYYTDTNGDTYCLIDVNPGATLPAGTVIHYDAAERKLYRSSNLVTDDLDQFEIVLEGSRLVKVKITAWNGKPETEPFDLISWIRLY